MTHHFQHCVDLAVRPHGVIGRRDFLRAIPAAAAASGFVSWSDVFAGQADKLRKKGLACIVLWMQGAPSQFETFSPKPGHEHGGETKSLATAVPGIEISENLPEVAKVMQDLCLIRSLSGKEGSHPRATYQMHTGYLPTASVKYPTLGSIVAHEIGNSSAELPNFVRIGRNLGAGSGGFLGVEFDPFELSDAKKLPDNTALPTSADRFRRRLGLLDRLEDNYSQNGGEREVTDHRKLYAKTSKLVLSPRMKAFDIQQESSATRAAYGTSGFAAGCLLARRLIEAGVTFVEVVAGNWDTHEDNFARSKSLCEEIDQPFAQLVRDLKERGRFDQTLLIWGGEFGRTPKINPRGGRDHYPKAYDAVLAGAGIRGGQVIGKTDRGGVEITDRPVTIPDLLQTVCERLAIDANKENRTSAGRPVKLVEGGQIIREAIG